MRAGSRPLAALLLGLLLLTTGCPRRDPQRDLTVSGPAEGPSTPAQAAEAELEALLATERALRAEQGEAMWALWVRGAPGATSAAANRYPALESPQTFLRLSRLRDLLPARVADIEHLGRALLGARLAAATQEVDGRIASLQATATLELEGASLPFHDLGRLLARESDARRRARLRDAVNEVEARLLPLLTERETRVEEAASALGLAPKAALALLLPAPPETLRRAALFLLPAADIEGGATLRAELDALARDRTGGPVAALPADALARLFAPEPGEEAAFPAARLLDDLDQLLAKLPSKPGTEPGASPRHALAACAATLAIGTEPKQAPLPLCLPVAPPADLRLAIAPRAGLRARLDALHEAVVCQALSDLDPKDPTASLDPHLALAAEARAHRALHAGLSAIAAGALPGGTSIASSSSSSSSSPGAEEARALAHRETLRLRVEARREAALLLSALDETPQTPTPGEDPSSGFFARALPLQPPTGAASAFERAFARAHLATLAARVLAVAIAHGFAPGAEI